MKNIAGDLSERLLDFGAGTIKYRYRIRILAFEICIFRKNEEQVVAKGK